MEHTELTRRLFATPELTRQAKYIADELANRGMPTRQGFQRFVDPEPKNEFSKECSALYDRIIETLQKDDNVKALHNLNPKPLWLRMSLPASQNKPTDLDILAYEICTYLLFDQKRSLDDYVESLGSTSLCDELSIRINKNGLTSLEDPRLELMNQGVIFDGKLVVYPHQFLRRYFNSSFVGMPALLRRAHNKGLSVSLRLDSFRKTKLENYIIDGLMEADHWRGIQFSEDLLGNKFKGGTTVHFSKGVNDLAYDAAFTVFRTKMMDENLREFSIEEYCPLINPTGENSCGWGEKYYIQKFGHLVYNQLKKCFEHVDGAIRVFSPEEYDNLFIKIKNNQDVDDKAGNRHKLFLVEGEFPIDDAQTLLNEWFRYNSHIQEYFCNVTVLPQISYEILEQAKKGTLNPQRPL